MIETMSKPKEQPKTKRLRLIQTATPETVRFVDRLRLKKEENYPECIKFNECYISAIEVEMDTHNPGSRQYFSADIVAGLNSKWISIKLWITTEELTAILNKSKNEKIRKQVLGLMTRVELLNEIPIREWFKTYMYITDLSFEVIQARDHEIPRNRMNLYTTKPLIEFLDENRPGDR